MLIKNLRHIPIFNFYVTYLLVLGLGMKMSKKGARLASKLIIMLYFSLIKVNL